MKLTFKNIDEETKQSLSNLKSLLLFEMGDGGTSVSVSKGEKIKVSMHGGKAEIIYPQKHCLFRAVSLLLEGASKSSEFEIEETPRFDTVCAMLDVSRGGVMTVDGVKRYINCMAAMGYNMLMLYTEDIYEIKKYPYFGYMRGRYSEKEIREIDDYAYSVGIELVPCIQTLGHMEQYLHWNATPGINDNGWTLLPDADETYVFIEDMIKTISSWVRSKKIHIGMDEPFGMGRGEYIPKFGFKLACEIFASHLKKVMAIVNKYGLEPIAWCDVFLVLSQEGDLFENSYGLTADLKITEKAVKEVPENLSLALCSYAGADDNEKLPEKELIKKYMDTGRRIYFAGGVWMWLGFTAENYMTLRNARHSIRNCKELGIRDYMTTVWVNNGAECDFFASLLGLQQVAEEAYNETVSDLRLKERFEFTTGGNFDILMRMSEFHHEPTEKEELYYGKKFFWQDVLCGLADEPLIRRPRSKSYENIREFIKASYAQGDRWEKYYNFGTALFDLMAKKTYIAENLKPAYDREDKDFLKKCADELFPELIKAVEKYHEIVKNQWFDSKKPFGWEIHDVRLAGIIERSKTAIERINMYLGGEIPCIDELTQDRLPADKVGTWYNQIACPARQM